MIEITPKHTPKYGNYFLATEAPRKRRRTSIRTVKSNETDIMTPDDDDDIQTPDIDIEIPDEALDIQVPDDMDDPEDLEIAMPLEDEIQTPDTEIQTPDNSGTEIQTPPETGDTEIQTPEADIQTPDAEIQTPDAEIQTPDDGGTDIQTPDDGGEQDTNFNNDTAGDNPEGGEQDTNFNNDIQTPDDGGEQDTNFNDDNGGDNPEGGTDIQTPDGGGEEQDTDFNDDGGNDIQTPDGGDANNQGGDNKGPGIDYDSTRKYNLFKDFMSLYTAIDNYIFKLEDGINDDIDTNQMIKVAVNKLREIKDLTYDYMIIKFETQTYVQSLLFYQNLVVAIQIVFRLLTNLKNKKIKENNSSK